MVRKALRVSEGEALAVARLRSEMNVRRMSIRTLSASAGISNTRLQAILRGERALSLGEFVDLCGVLNLDPATVLKDVKTGLFENFEK